MHRSSSRTLVSMAALVCLAAGCTPNPGTGPARPALINHPVFFQLVDASEAAELIADCDTWIAEIPGVASYYCGRPFDSERESVDTDYDVGLYVGFASAEDYMAYVEHPVHVRLVEKWRPRLRGILVRDVIDETP